MSTIVWEGITLSYAHTATAFGGPFDHIEVKAAEPLPITETGYRSHFMLPEELELWDSVEAFILEWLNDAAKLPTWQEYRSQSRQLSLF
jgi:hypothetical protein